MGALLIRDAIPHHTKPRHAMLHHVAHQEKRGRWDRCIKRRDAVFEAIKLLWLPPNPLDTLVDRLGGMDEVAELTGRKMRLVRDTNTNKVFLQPRTVNGESQEEQNQVRLGAPPPSTHCRLRPTHPSI